MKSLQVISFLLMHIGFLLTRAHEATDGTQNQFSATGCGEVKGCFDCIDGCGGTASWVPDVDENVVKFSLWGPLSGDTGYVALGISQNEDMEESDVYACIVDGGTTSFKRYWTPSKTVNLVDTKGVTGQEVTLIDGELRCQFTRNMSLDDNDPQFYDISGNTSYHLLIASAASISGGNLVQHTSRGWSGQVVLSQNFSAAPAPPDDSLPLMKAHGCLMTIAWLCLVDIAILTASHFKPMWPDSKICGVKVWFAIHRSLMVTALVMFVIGFIIIFVHVGGIITYENSSSDSLRRFAHTVLGIIATALGITNPIMALFRPHPGTPKRPIFNVAHKTVGYLANITSLVTIGIALAFYDGTAIISGMDEYLVWVFVAFCVFSAVIWIILEVLKCCSKNNDQTDDIPLGAKGDPTPINDSESRSGSSLKMIIWVLYVLGALFATAFIVISIAII